MCSLKCDKCKNIFNLFIFSFFFDQLFKSAENFSSGENPAVMKVFFSLSVLLNRCVWGCILWSRKRCYCVRGVKTLIRGEAYKTTQEIDDSTKIRHRSVRVIRKQGRLVFSHQVYGKSCGCKENQQSSLQCLIKKKKKLLQKDRELSAHK